MNDANVVLNFVRPFEIFAYGLISDFLLLYLLFGVYAHLAIPVSSS